MFAIFLAPLAFTLERLLGYSDWLVERVGHPVIWIGRLIDWLDRSFNTGMRTPETRKILGIVALAIVILVTGGLALAITLALRLLPFGWVIEASLAIPFLASKQLGEMVQQVADALTLSLDAGREAVSHIVGRDVRSLDRAGVSRAAIETLAENASDGVVAPLFWLLLAGLPGIALYKAINTADSMIGHRSEKYRAFGWASARLDDWVNLIPARLSALLIVAACFFHPKASPSAAWATARRDAPKHDSPNAGWPEAAFAGALGITLGGPRAYDGDLHDLPSFGTGPADLGPWHIVDALKLYRAMMDVTLAATTIAAFVWLAIALRLWG